MCVRFGGHHTGTPKPLFLGGPAHHVIHGFAFFLLVLMSNISLLRGQHPQLSLLLHPRLIP